MGQLIFITAALLLLAFLLSKQTFIGVVTSRIRGGGGSFCPPDYVPNTLGVAPEWRNVTSLNTRVRFFIDPSTGCIFQNNASLTQRLAPIVVLTDAVQIADFISLNGEPPVAQGGTQIEVLGPALRMAGANPTCPVGYQPQQVADDALDTPQALAASGGFSKAWQCIRRI